MITSGDHILVLLAEIDQSDLSGGGNPRRIRAPKWQFITTKLQPVGKILKVVSLVRESEPQDGRNIQVKDSGFIKICPEIHVGEYQSHGSVMGFLYWFIFEPEFSHAMLNFGRYTTILRFLTFENYLPKKTCFFGLNKQVVQGRNKQNPPQKTNCQRWAS